MLEESPEGSVRLPSEFDESRSCHGPITYRSFHDAHPQPRIERRKHERLEELSEHPRILGREEAGAVELVLFEQACQLAPVGDAGEDVGGGAPRLPPAPPPPPP